MVKLHHDEVRALWRVAIEADLARSREALLIGISPSIVSALPEHRRPGEQLLSDINALNETGQTTDEEQPLVRWLQNAASLASRTPSGRAFESVLARLTGKEEPAAAALPGSSSAPLPLAAVPQTEAPSPGPASRFDVFLCHSSKDKHSVQGIARRLQERGLSPWLDEWAIQPGRPWQIEIEEQIRSISAAAVFVGASGLGPWQRTEVDALLRELHDRGCPIIPVLLPDAKEEVRLPPFLAGMHWVDFRRSHPDPMEQLVWGVTGSKPPGASGRTSWRPGRWGGVRKVAIALSVIGVVAFGIYLYSIYRSRAHRAVLEKLVSDARRASEGLTFYEACLAPRPTPRTLNEVSAQLLNERSQGPYDCDEPSIEKLLTDRPMFVLAEPGAGKRFALLRLQRSLAERGSASLILTVRDCLHINGPAPLRRCLEEKLEGQVLDRDSDIRRAAKDLLSRSDWWLLIDGVDEAGEQSRVADYLIDLAELHAAHGDQIVVSGKGENLAHVLHLIPSDDRIRRLFIDFQRVYVHGLRADGAARMASDVATDPAGIAGLETIRRASSCGGDIAALASDILRRPSFIRRAFSRERPFSSPGDPCSEQVGVDLARWLEEAQFDDYCSSLCGDDRVQLQSVVKAIVGQLARRPSNQITRPELVALIPPDAGSLSADRVIRTVLNTGALAVLDASTFRILRYRLYHRARGSGAP